MNSWLVIVFILPQVCVGKDQALSLFEQLLLLLFGIIANFALVPEAKLRILGSRECMRWVLSSHLDVLERRPWADPPPPDFAVLWLRL